jgi:hypothetical protein
VVHTKASPGRRASLRKVFADEIADEARSSGNGKRSANEKKKNGALQRSANGKPKLVTELIGNWEEAARLREFVRAIEKQTAQSDFSEEERNDIQQLVEWTKKYADLVDPLSDLPDAIEEFVRPESRQWWLE